MRNSELGLWDVRSRFWFFAWAIIGGMEKSIGPEGLSYESKGDARNDARIQCRKRLQPRCV
jgi:hypothetical protein